MTQIQNPTVQDPQGNLMQNNGVMLQMNGSMVQNNGTIVQNSSSNGMGTQITSPSHNNGHMHSNATSNGPISTNDSDPSGNMPHYNTALTQGYHAGLTAHTSGLLSTNGGIDAQSSRPDADVTPLDKTNTASHGADHGAHQYQAELNNSNQYASTRADRGHICVDATSKLSSHAARHQHPFALSDHASSGAVCPELNQSLTADSSHTHASQRNVDNSHSNLHKESNGHNDQHKSYSAQNHDDKSHSHSNYNGHMNDAQENGKTSSVQNHQHHAFALSPSSNSITTHNVNGKHSPKNATLPHSQSLTQTQTLPQLSASSSQGGAYPANGLGSPNNSLNNSYAHSMKSPTLDGQQVGSCASTCMQCMHV
jgi:hypothetical protein